MRLLTVDTGSSSVQLALYASDVEALIGPDTVNTLPPETLDAYREHGDPALRLEEHPDMTNALPGQLAALGLDLDEVSAELERQGVQKFIEPYDKLLATLKQRATKLKT